MHSDGKIMYISETASVHLGLPQIDLTGSSIFDFVDPADHNDVCEALRLNETDRSQLPPPAESFSETMELGRSFCMRMKCILPKRNAGLVMNGHKAIYCNGYLKVRARLSARKFEFPCNNNQLEEQRQIAMGDDYQVLDQDADSNHMILKSRSLDNHEAPNCDWEPCALVAVGHSLLPSGTTEIKLNGSAFMFRANLDLKLYFVESLVSSILGFDQMEMVGSSLYQFIHVNDTSSVEQSHRSLLSKSQVVTKYFRFMRRDGGCVWVQCYATLVNNPRSVPRPQHVVGFCQVISEDCGDQSLAMQERTANQLMTTEQKMAETEFPLETGEKNNLIYWPVRAKSATPNQKLATKIQKMRKPRNLTTSNQSARTKANIFAPLITKSSEKLSLAYQKRHQLLEQPQQIITSDHSPPATDLLPAPYHYNSSLTASIINEPVTVAPPIGSIRRVSDDSCSVVSSVASTSISSVSSLSSCNSNNFVSSHHQIPEYPSYISAMDVCQTSGDYLHDSTIQYQGNCQQRDSKHQEQQHPIEFYGEYGQDLPVHNNNIEFRQNPSDQTWASPNSKNQISISRKNSNDSTSMESACQYANRHPACPWDSQQPEIDGLYQNQSTAQSIDCYSFSKSNPNHYYDIQQTGYIQYASYADLATQGQQHLHNPQMEVSINQGNQQTLATV